MKWFNCPRYCITLTWITNNTLSNPPRKRSIPQQVFIWKSRKKTRKGELKKEKPNINIAFSIRPMNLICRFGTIHIHQRKRTFLLNIHNVFNSNGLPKVFFVRVKKGSVTFDWIIFLFCWSPFNLRIHFSHLIAFCTNYPWELHYHPLDS